MSDLKGLPRSRLARLGNLAALGARTGLRRLTGSGDESDVAELLTSQLGAMRGLALKIGQMASYVDGVIPEAKRPVYEKALAALRSQAAQMSPSAARRVVQTELGAPPEELFTNWEEKPFASASIGQVHRATLRDGRRVAVKVQHEGVDEAVQADLANGKLLMSMLGPLGAKFDAKGQVDELRQRFTEELDYRIEAAAQERFRRLFSSDPQIAIPEVIADRSGRRVLTTTFAEGIGFEDAVLAPEAERRAWASALFRFVFESVLLEGVLNADPHPGNYVLVPGGRLHVLDFGCTRELSAPRLEAIRRVHEAGARGDLAAFREWSLRLVDMVPGSPQGLKARDHLVSCFAGLFVDGEYTFTREFAASMVTELREQALLVAKSKAADVRPLPAELLFFNRLQVGFYSVLARLNVAVNYHALHVGIVNRIRRN